MASYVRQAVPAAFRARLVNGRWHKPMVSNRHIAQLRKEVLMLGGVWHLDAALRPKKPLPPKGHKRHIEDQARKELIAEKMKEMPAKLEDFKKARKASKKPSNSPKLLDYLKATGEL